MRNVTLLGERSARLPAGPSHPECNAGMSFTTLREAAPRASSLDQRGDRPRPNPSRQSANPEAPDAVTKAFDKPRPNNPRKADLDPEKPIFRYVANNPG